jgi:transcriptional regulator with XRE-family HTH domain
VSSELDKKRPTKQKERDRWNRAIVTVIRAARDDADVTQQELANRLGFTHRQVVNMEHGRRAIHASDLIMIAKALNEDPETLMRRIVRW